MRALVCAALLLTFAASGADQDGPGSPNKDFGVDGVVASNPAANDQKEEIRDILIEAEHLYLAGTAQGIPGGQWRVEKRDRTTGALVADFGTGGLVTSDIGEAALQPLWVSIQSGKMYVVGYRLAQWRIERRNLPDGSLDPSYGRGGVLSFTGFQNGATMDSQHLYAVTTGRPDSGSDHWWSIEKRSLADGSLVSGFGDGGVIAVNPSPGKDYPVGVQTGGSSLYVFGEDLTPGDAQWRIEKRSLADGSLDPDFGEQGVALSNPTKMHDSPSGVEVGDAHLLVIGSIWGRSRIRCQWFCVEKRNLADGSLDPAFGKGGAVTMNVGARRYLLRASQDALYVLWDQFKGWRVQKRDLTKGSIVPGYGHKGILLESPKGAVRAFDFEIDATSLYVGGHGQSQDDWEWRLESRGN